MALRYDRPHFCSVEALKEVYASGLIRRGQFTEVSLSSWRERMDTFPSKHLLLLRLPILTN